MSNQTNPTFKVGDRVRRVSTSTSWSKSWRGMSIGDIDTVVCARLTGIDLKVFGGGHSSQNFELVERSPTSITSVIVAGDIVRLKTGTSEIRVTEVQVKSNRRMLRGRYRASGCDVDWRVCRDFIRLPEKVEEKPFKTLRDYPEGTVVKLKNLSFTYRLTNGVLEDCRGFADKWTEVSSAFSRRWREYEVLEVLSSPKAPPTPSSGEYMTFAEAPIGVECVVVGATHKRYRRTGHFSYEYIHRQDKTFDGWRVGSNRPPSLLGAELFSSQAIPIPPKPREPQIWDEYVTLIGGCVRFKSRLGPILCGCDINLKQAKAYVAWAEAGYPVD